MNTSLNKPTETNPLRQNDERYVLVSQEFPPQEDGMDLADLVIAAWKNRFLFTISWVILAVITFVVIQALNMSTINTEIRSGFLDKTPIQTPDAMRDQITKLIFPSAKQALEQQLQRPVSAKITTDIKKTSDYLKITISSSGLSRDQFDTCMKSVTQKWGEYQTAEMNKFVQANTDLIALITQESNSIQTYANSLASTKPLEPTEANRLLTMIEAKKQQVFNLQQSTQRIEPPIVTTRFDYVDSDLGRGIKGMAVSVFAGAVLSFGVVFAASIIRTAKARLANS
jgi:hypothetical protein